MAMSDEILSQISIADLAARLGTDEASARQAVETALPALLAGVSGEAANPNEREKLAVAVARDHDANLLDSDDPLAQVDIADGDRIVHHLFGDQRGEVETHLERVTGGGAGSLVSKLLPILAPLVMSWVARKMTGTSGSESSGGGGLGDILGQVLGGGSTGTSGAGSATGGGGLGDILGGVLGGATASGGAGGGGLGDVLGQLGGQAGGGGGLDDLLGSILGGVAKR